MPISRKSWVNRALGILMLVGAALGAVLSIAGLIATWRAERPLTERLDTGFALLDKTLDTSASGLVVMNASLETTGEIIGTLKASASDLSQSMKNTIPLVNQTGELVGEDMSAVVLDTQASLDAAQASARLVDDTLRVITSLPLIGRRYAPTMPLGESIAQVSESLDGLPDSFAEVQRGMVTAADNLEAIQKELGALSADIDEAGESLNDAQGIVADYQAQVTDLQDRMERFQKSLPNWLRGIKFGLTFVMIWLLIAQAGLLTQGLQLLHETAVSET